MTWSTGQGLARAEEKNRELEGIGVVLFKKAKMGCLGGPGPVLSSPGPLSRGGRRWEVVPCSSCQGVLCAGEAWL